MSYIVALNVFRVWKKFLAFEFPPILALNAFFRWKGRHAGFAAFRQIENLQGKLFEENR
jgi:hypothetical protein